MNTAATKVAQQRKLELEALDRAALEATYQAYYGTKCSVAAYPSSYLIDRMLPMAPVKKRGPRMARHCLDNGVS